MADKGERTTGIGSELKSVSSRVDYDGNVMDGVAEKCECPVCLQPCIHPVQLPCGHVFCYLCVKGVSNQSRRCALCRDEIPNSFLFNPKLVDSSAQEDVLPPGDTYQWFYEGNAGWWQYDERTNTEIEDRHKKDQKVFDLLIAGFVYVIDLNNMRQYRRNDPSRRRRIKRDFANAPKKGIAGLKIGSVQSREGGEGQEFDNQRTVPGRAGGQQQGQLTVPGSNAQGSVARAAHQSSVPSLNICAGQSRNAQPSNAEREQSDTEQISSVNTAPTLDNSYISQNSESPVSAVVGENSDHVSDSDDSVLDLSSHVAGLQITSDSTDSNSSGNEWD